MSILFVAGLLSLLAAPSPRPPRVLFVGNSLTCVNDLPAMVARISASIGAPLETHSIVAPNYGLEDHWNDGIVQGLLTRERWDVVVLQQGPSSLPESGTNLIDYTARFGTIIRAAGACPAVYTRHRSAPTSRHFIQVSVAETLRGLAAPCVPR